MKSVMQHQFSQAPTADIPRSSFNRSSGYKTTFDVDRLIPIFVDEVLPGDTFNMHAKMFARLNTPIYPILDNMYMDVHWFFVPYRQVWDNFRKFMGERVDPADSIDYTIPVKNFATGVSVHSIADYMGLPAGINNTQSSALPFRAYSHIYNEWYRDQNLIDSTTVDTTDGPDTGTAGNASPFKRGKRHDYFTSALPWLQKGDAVSLPLGISAPVEGISTNTPTFTDGTDTDALRFTAANPDRGWSISPTNTADVYWDNPQLQADLSGATAATINELRQAFQIQKLLERDARSGTRYAEIVKSHFNVQFQDVTYRPEFLGGSSDPVMVSPIPQTSNDGTNGSVGQLGAIGVVSSNSGFTKSFVEHGVVIGIASVRADLTYQQGMDRYWRRSTRYDFYWPALAHIGEQAVDMGEIYYVDNTTDTDTDGTVDNDEVFGYQERYAEYRYKPSKVTGKMRSAATGTLDVWHLSEEFGSAPGLDQTFIESNTPIDRIVEVTTEPDFRLDAYFNLQCARPMPLYSIPGFIDHF